MALQLLLLEEMVVGFCFELWIKMNKQMSNANLKETSGQVWL